MDLAVWRDISLLWLIFLSLIAVLPFGAAFFYAIKGLIRLRQLAREYLPLAQEKAVQVANVTEDVSQKITRPFIGAHAARARVDGVARAILRRKGA